MAISQKAFAALQKQVAQGTLSVELYHKIVWEEYHNFVWNVVKSACFKPALEKDCFQEAAIIFFKKLPAYDPKIAKFTTFIRPWLRLFILNFVFTSQLPVKMSALVSHRRAKAEAQPSSISVFSQGKITRFRNIKDTRDGYNQTSARADLEKLARKLTMRQRDMVFSYYGIGKPVEGYRQIAERYSLTHQRVQQIVNVSLLKLGWKPRRNGHRRNNKNY